LIPKISANTGWRGKVKNEEESKYQHALRITGLLVGIDMPNNVIWQTNYFISRPLSHLRESFRLSLILKCVAWEVDSCIGD
jgi:hypothetical protein